MSTDNYERKILNRTYKVLNDVTDFIPNLHKLEKLLCDVGWASQVLSYQVFREEGVFDLYDGDEKLNGRHVSDRLADAFYQSSSLDEFYTKLNMILLEREARDVTE
jgi:hypothetical protein